MLLVKKQRDKLSACSRRSSSSSKVLGTAFELPSRYKYLKLLGHGAFGVVISAFDERIQKKVAIKKLSNIFRDTTDAKRVLREIRLLRRLDHQNIIQIQDIFSQRTEYFNDIYIVNEQMDTDLHQIIYSPQFISLNHIRYFIFQILSAVSQMHAQKITHRDLKPSNILVNSDCTVKICDLGLAREVPKDHLCELTEYVVTRWYRAPEIMLSCKEYSEAIDMWSVGCIFGELVNRAPLFPGKNYLDQMQMIFRKLGQPTESNMDFVTNPKARKFIMMLPPTQLVSFESLFSCTDPLALDLLSDMLAFDPSKRVSANEALDHQFIKTFFTAKPKQRTTGVIDSADLISMTLEREVLSVDDLRYYMNEEIKLYQPEFRHRIFHLKQHNCRKRVFCHCQRCHSFVSADEGTNGASVKSKRLKQVSCSNHISCYRCKLGETFSSCSETEKNVLLNSIISHESKSFLQHSNYISKKDLIFRRWNGKGGAAGLLLAAAEVINEDE